MAMQLYDENDLDVLKNKIGEIIEKIEETKLQIYEPTKKEQMEVNHNVLEYLKTKEKYMEDMHKIK